MGPPRRGEGRRWHGRWLLLLALAGLGALQWSTIGLAAETTVEPTETASGYAWKPAAVTSAPGGSVAFRNPGYVVPHGVHWTGGPEKPACSGVPVDSSGTSWSGACTFAQAGTYSFVCTVHPEEMKGTITVVSDEAAPAPSPGPGAPAAPEGQIVEALQLARSQRGRAVRGSVATSSAAVGGGLTIELEAKAAALGGRAKGMVRVGGLARALAEAGRQPFAVMLKAPARKALQRRGRLSVNVTIVVSPPNAPVVKMTRRVELHE
ncbi:MAG TPA: plastocyanin/azurin family copper-binding protein [Solirubrobacterales bacterium]|nr:plastocyanin/azurin family copper-binding protein [Solirubrobacterales bacterium]